jgi:hypothetical protein
MSLISICFCRVFGNTIDLMKGCASVVSCDRCINTHDPAFDAFFDAWPLPGFRRTGAPNSENDDEEAKSA